MSGYHLSDIPKGRLGDLSKVMEELLEAMDAESQGSKIMVALELSDLIGALEAYLEGNLSGVSLDDLRTMSLITKRAFSSGERV